MRTFSPDERIIGRYAAVGPDPHHLAQMAGEILGLVALRVTFAQGHEKRTVTGDYQPGTEVVTPVRIVALREDLFHLRQALVIHLEPRPRHRGAHAVGRPLGKTEENQAVGRKIGTHDHIQQAALPPHIYRRHASQRR